MEIASRYVFIYGCQAQTDGFTFVVRNKKRRRGSTSSEHVARQPSKPGEQRNSQERKRPTGPRAVPPQEIKATRANIADSKARQTSSTQDNYIFVELCPDLSPYNYLQAIDKLVGGPRNITQFNRMNGHYIVGLESKDLASRLVENGLEIEGTTFKVFPYRKRAERIVVANLPGFVEDITVVEALRPYGNVTSIAPILIKMGEYAFTDRRREAFILLNDGVKLEKLPTRLDIKSKVDTLPAFLSFGIKCSKCGKQGHRRTNCPALARRNFDDPKRMDSPAQVQAAPPTVPKQTGPPTTMSSPPAPPAPSEEAPSNATVTPAAAPGAPALHPARPLPPPGEAPSSTCSASNPPTPSLPSPAPIEPMEVTQIEEEGTGSSQEGKNKIRNQLDAFLQQPPPPTIFDKTNQEGLEEENVRCALVSTPLLKKQLPHLTPAQRIAMSELVEALLRRKLDTSGSLYKRLLWWRITSGSPATPRVDIALVQETNAHHLDGAQDLCLGYDAVTAPPDAISGSGLACIYAPGVTVSRHRILWPGHIVLAAINVHGQEMTVINVHLSHDQRERIEQLRVIEAAEVEEKEAWVLGNFNIREDRNRDSISMAALGALCESAALLDAASEFDAAHLPTRPRPPPFQQPRVAAMLRSGMVQEHMNNYLVDIAGEISMLDASQLWDRWTLIKAGILAEARSLHDPRHHDRDDGYIGRAQRYIRAQLEASSTNADYPSLPDLARLTRHRHPAVTTNRDENGTVIEGPVLRRKALDIFRPRIARPSCDPAEYAAFIGATTTTPIELGEEDPLHRAEVSEAEVAAAIRHLPRGRAPGWDGLPSEVLSTFEEFFADALRRVLAESQLRGALPPSVRRSEICLVPKARGGGVGSILLGRLRPHLPTLVPECQTYAVPGRSPSWNITRVTDAVEEATAGGTPLAAVSVDLQSAFDSLDRGYITSLLVSHLRLPPAFVGWILLLYAGADATVRVGGFQTAAFKLLKGVRQGCALSAALFSIATGPLLRRLETILGVGNVIAYADDIVLLIHRDEQFARAAAIFESFHRASGIAVNYSKSAGLWCGAWRDRGDSPLGASWSNSSIQVLGTRIATRSFVVQREQPLLALLESACRRTTPFTRGLSLDGRARAANSLVLSTIQHHLHAYLPEASIISKLQACVARFIWGPDNTALLASGILARPVSRSRSEGGGRNGFSRLVTGDAWLRPTPDGTTLQPRRLRLLRLWEETSGVLSLDHRAAPTTQLLDLHIIGGCRFLRPPNLLAPSRWVGARIRDLGDYTIVPPTRFADAAALAAFCRKIVAENIQASFRVPSLAEAVVLRGTTKPLANTTTRSARRALERPRLAALPIHRLLARWMPTVDVPPRVDWSSLRRGAFSGHNADVALRLALHALPHPDHPASAGRPPDLQAWIFGTGLEQDDISILSSAKSRVYRHFIQHVNPAAARDVTAPPTAATTSEIPANPASLNWGDSEMAEVDANDGFTVVKSKKRRRGSTSSEHAARQPSRPAEKRSSQQQKRPTGPRSMPPQEIKATRANIADARARQTSTTHENYIYVELCPEFPTYTYLRAIGKLVGGPGKITQFNKMNGHYLGLDIEGTHLRVFPFRKRAERIVIANLPGFVEDGTIVEALRHLGNVTSIAPIMIKMGEYTFSDGRREAFILLREGVRLETLPTRLTIKFKGDTLSAFLSFGIKCSKCGKQGHRRANCPSLARQNSSPRQAASPTDPAEPKDFAQPAPVALPAPLTTPRPLEPGIPPLDLEMSEEELTSPPSTPSGKGSLLRKVRDHIARFPTLTIDKSNLHGQEREDVMHLITSKTTLERRLPSLLKAQVATLVDLTNAILNTFKGSSSSVYKTLRNTLGLLNGRPQRVTAQHRLDIAFVQETNAYYLGSGQDLCLGYNAVVLAHPLAISGSELAGPGVAVLQQRILWPGHIALATIDVHGEEMTAINVHLAHEPRERNKQLEFLAATAAQEEEGACWIFGDFNIRNRGPSSSSSSLDALAALLDLAALVDVATQFDAAHLPTRVTRHGDQVESSRLDRFLVPAGVLDRVSTYATSHYHLSDHRLVLLQVGPPTAVSPTPTQPRLAAMLRSGLALEHLAGYIRELEEDTAHDDDDGTFWDRWTTIKAVLLAEARSLHDPRHAASDSYVYRARRYIAAQLEASSIRADYPSLPDLARAIRLRPPVSVIRDEEDNIIEGPSFGGGRTRPSSPASPVPPAIQPAGAAFIASSALTTTRELSEEDPLHRQDISPSEIDYAIQHLPRGKAPGWDDLPCELLVAFNEDFFAEALARVFAASRLRGALPPSTRRSSICLVPKARGGRGLEGYRPVALPSADYRVLAAILHRRFKLLLRTMVPEEEDQVYRKNLAGYKRRTKRAKRKHWREQCNTVLEKDPYGLPYRIVSGKIRSSVNLRLLEDEDGFKTRDLKETLDLILDQHFGNQEPEDEISLTTCGGAKLVLYADDQFLIIEATSRAKAEKCVETSLQILSNWAHYSGLRSNVAKTKALSFKSRDIRTKRKGIRWEHKPAIRMEGRRVSVVDRMTILGLVIDEKLGWQFHAEEMVAKGRGALCRLSRLALNRGGEGQGGAWWRRNKDQKVATTLERVQRTAALRITGGYRITSTEALLVLAGLIPLGLKLEEEAIRQKIWEDRKDALGLEAGTWEWKRDPRKPPQWLPKWNWSPGVPTGIGTEVFTNESKVDELVYSAELVAIREALRVCAEKNLSPERLYSDCMSALVAINLEKGQHARQIIQELEMMPQAPALHWVRGHSLIEGGSGGMSRTYGWTGGGTVKMGGRYSIGYQYPSTSVRFKIKSNPDCVCGERDVDARHYVLDCSRVVGAQKERRRARGAIESELLRNHSKLLEKAHDVAAELYLSSKGMLRMPACGPSRSAGAEMPSAGWSTATAVRPGSTLHRTAPVSSSAVADAAALGAFCRRLTSENAVGFGAESTPSSGSLAAAVVLRGPATPFLNGLTTRLARRALDRLRLAATPTIGPPPSRIDRASLRRCAFSGHETDAALKLALHALPHPVHPASIGPSCPACGSIDRSLGHRYWCCRSIRPHIREAFNIIGRPPDLQAWIFGGFGGEGIPGEGEKSDHTSLRSPWTLGIFDQILDMQQLSWCGTNTYSHILMPAALQKTDIDPEQLLYTPKIVDNAAAAVIEMHGDI
ncbi:hypothetical protein LAZ67_11002056 [Cordylochernes scorpioides]|uniref:Reverse transcriptase n=1 Tax=Cordylochernes scorpioides TaxID=51811 RepID=A0ABY6L2C6_9ARAC|nr:hypothetical protein LAZ67_11002056 [Cordylochernes scorpioides]